MERKDLLVPILNGDFHLRLDGKIGKVQFSRKPWDHGKATKKKNGTNVRLSVPGGQ
jgi:hypothetical protein